jgi:hypothetical protein
MTELHSYLDLNPEPIASRLPKLEYHVIRRINWGSYSTGQLAIVDCPDCGDMALVSATQSRCDTCKQYDQDSAAAMLRAHTATVLAECAKERAAIAENRAQLVAHAVRLGPVICDVLSRGRGMNDERQLFCDFCGDVGLTVAGDTSSEQIDMWFGTCESCRKPGKGSVHDDGESAYAEFHAFTPEDM